MKYFNADRTKLEFLICLFIQFTHTERRSIYFINIIFTAGVKAYKEFNFLNIYWRSTFCVIKNLLQLIIRPEMKKHLSPVFFPRWYHCLFRCCVLFIYRTIIGTLNQSITLYCDRSKCKYSYSNRLLPTD
jgi:hypothetical protein